MKIEKEYIDKVTDYLNKFYTYLDINMSTSTHFFEKENSSKYQDCYKVKKSLLELQRNLEILREKLE